MKRKNAHTVLINFRRENRLRTIYCVTTIDVSGMVRKPSYAMKTDILLWTQNSTLFIFKHPTSPLYIGCCFGIILPESCTPP